MFSGLTNYFFGTDDENICTNDLCELYLIEEDNEDWVVIEHGKRKDENDLNDECFKKQDDKKLLSNNFNIDISGKTKANIGTMEGSWFVTPPPCFSNSKNLKLASSPLEDILIEHPSISVFNSDTSSERYSQTSSSKLSAKGQNKVRLPSISPTLSPAKSESITSTTRTTPIVSTSPTKTKASSDYKCLKKEVRERVLPSAKLSQHKGRRRITVRLTPIPPSPPSSSSPTAAASATTKTTTVATATSPSAVVSNTTRTSSIVTNSSKTRTSSDYKCVKKETKEKTTCRLRQRPGLLAEFGNVLPSMSPKYGLKSSKFLKKSYMNRQNLVLFRGHKSTTRKQQIGCSNNRRQC